MVRVLIEEMEAYAKENRVPIMMPDGISFLEQYIETHHVKRILEIGTAIGYSAIRMAIVDPEIKVVTIERDQNRYEQAILNIQKANLQDQIQVVLADALTADIEGKFDLIFIDAAKSQYIKFFERYEDNLMPDGVIISDNLNFHGLTHVEEQTLSKNVRQLVRKINRYIAFLKENSEFETEFLEIGDGIGISKRIGQG